LREVVLHRLIFFFENDDQCQGEHQSAGLAPIVAGLCETVSYGALKVMIKYAPN